MYREGGTESKEGKGHGRGDAAVAPCAIDGETKLHSLKVRRADVKARQQRKKAAR